MVDDLAIVVLRDLELQHFPILGTISVGRLDNDSEVFSAVVDLVGLAVAELAASEQAARGVVAHVLENVVVDGLTAHAAELDEASRRGLALRHWACEGE